MAYFDNTNNASFYSAPSAPSTSGEFHAYPHLGQTLATDTEYVTGQPYTAPTSRWNVVGRPGSIVESPTSLRATASLESPYTTRTDGYYRPSYDWAAAYQQIQSHRPGFLSSDGSFVSTTASEMSAAMSTPSSVPFDHWGTNQSGAATNGFYTDSVDTSLRPRAEMMPAVWFEPYGVTRTRSNWHRNAEAGSSTLVAPPVPYIDQPRSQPPGGSSKATVDAKIDKPMKKDRAPKLKRARLPYGEGKPRATRVKTGKDGRILCEWVQQRKKRSEPPTFNKALKTMAKLIPLVQDQVYQEPRLKTEPVEQTVPRSKNAKIEYERRNVERRWYRELSQFYELPEGKIEWTRPPLLLKVLADLKRIPPPPEKPNRSPA